MNLLAAFNAAQSAVMNKVPHEMLLLDLYGSLRSLDEITGATTKDDILNLIFSTFLHREVATNAPMLLAAKAAKSCLIYGRRHAERRSVLVPNQAE